MNLRDLRRQNVISSEAAIVRDIVSQELYINTDPGRCCRPLFIVEDQRIKMKKHQISDLKRSTQDANDVCCHLYAQQQQQPEH
jgi:DNA-directed RNA polymerase II subunit RPB2